ncbi:DUF397 domain-containing protein [Streptomyces sp. CRN 30]|nr:DUF397 domain-containing protein [Streptomyces sp. CRN 30]
MRLRESKRADGPVLLLGPAAWSAFVRRVSGRFTGV